MGHAMLHGLYCESLKHNVQIFSEYFALDLIMDKEEVLGAIALCMEDGSIHRLNPLAIRDE